MSTKSQEGQFRARCEYGREQRRNFYKREAGESKADGLDFAESFEDIIKEAPEGLPPSVSGKIAVFYADGNKFTKIREKSQSIAELGDFSEKLLKYQRGMLGELLDWLRARGGSQYWEAYLQYPSKVKGRPFWPLRFETLLWGGDELTFVMPAWLGIDFARKFCEKWTKGWTARGEPTGAPLTFGMGLVFCHEKTPIRQARKMAKIMAEDAKETLGGKLEHVLQIEAFESIALPEYENGLARYRASLFDLDDDFDKEKLAGALTLRGGEINKTMEAIETLKDGAFARSQIYNLLRSARINKDGNHAFSLHRGKADNDLAAEAQKYFKRMGSNEDEGLNALRILGDKVPLAYSLAVISSLWDYVEPLAHVPAKTAVGQTS
ncbi:MAG: hypothetical protein WCC90_09110 [Methylocella sp.]